MTMRARNEVLAILVGFVLGMPSFFFLSGCSTLPKNGAPEASASYYCSMHPEVTSDRPGTCPTCNMDLNQRR